MPRARRPARKPIRKPRLIRKRRSSFAIPGVSVKGRIAPNKYWVPREPDEFTVDLRKTKKPKVKIIR